MKQHKTFVRIIFLLTLLIGCISSPHEGQIGSDALANDHCTESWSNSSVGLDCNTECEEIAGLGCTNGPVSQDDCANICDAFSGPCRSYYDALIDCSGPDPAWICVDDGSGSGTTSPSLQGCEAEMGCLISCVDASQGGGPPPPNGSGPITCEPYGGDGTVRNFGCFLHENDGAHVYCYHPGQHDAEDVEVDLYEPCTGRTETIVFGFVSAFSWCEPGEYCPEGHYQMAREDVPNTPFTGCPERVRVTVHACREFSDVANGDPSMKLCGGPGLFDGTTVLYDHICDPPPAGP